MATTKRFANSIPNIKISWLNDKNFDRKFLAAFRIDGVDVQRSMRSTRHFKTLRGYLFWDEDGLNAKTMIEENDYYSLSYSGDYKNYYAQCFKPYSKTCKRIHFFNKYITPKRLQQLLNNKKLEEDLRNCYLGSIIVKPLSDGFLGATLLKPYDNSNKKGRYYTAIKEYPVNLFGKHTSIKTLAFQEQDQIVANCASSSLWFAFNKTSDLFQSKVPNPSDITLAAGVNFKHSGWFFPSDALTVEQIGRAINANDMVSALLLKLEYLQHDKWIKSFIYAFSKTGIPVLLGMKTKGSDLQHMVTINGYRFAKKPEFPKPVSTIGKPKLPNGQLYKNPGPNMLDEVKLVSDNIIKFYAHDDQVGPFTRLQFIMGKRQKGEVKVAKSDGKEEHVSYQFRMSCWKSATVEEPIYDAYATAVIIPLAKSILLPYQTVIANVTKLNESMIDFWTKNGVDLEFVWDVYLDSSKMYKKDIRKLITKRTNNAKDAAKVLYMAMPEYLWVVRCNLLLEGKYMDLGFDILYDASDLDVHNIFHTNFYHQTFKKIMATFNLIKKDRDKEKIVLPSFGKPI